MGLPVNCIAVDFKRRIVVADIMPRLVGPDLPRPVRGFTYLPGYPRQQA